MVEKQDISKHLATIEAHTSDDAVHKMEAGSDAIIMLKRRLFLTHDQVVLIIAQIERIKTLAIEKGYQGILDILNEEV